MKASVMLCMRKITEHVKRGVTSNDIKITVFENGFPLYHHDQECRLMVCNRGSVTLIGVIHLLTQS